MDDKGYSYFFRNLPHLVLILMIGFITMIIFLPIALIHYYPPHKEIDFFLIFPDFWNRVLIYTSNLNWIVLALVILGGSYAFGFIFMGFYDAIGLHIIRIPSRHFAKWLYPLVKLLRRLAEILHIIGKNEMETRGWYYWENRIAEDKNISNKYNIGNIEYAKLMGWFHKPENAHLREYYYWEFLKTVSCEYLGVLVFSLFFFSLLVYFPCQCWQNFITKNFLDTNISLKGSVYSCCYLVGLFVFYLFLLYGQACYKSALRKALKAVVDEYEKEFGIP